MPIVSPIIEGIVNQIPDTKYLRDTDQDANIDVDQLDLEGLTIVIYNNLPTVSHEIGTHGQLIYRRWPVELKILRLAELDDTGSDGDQLRAICLGVADQIYDRIASQPIISKIVPLNGYDIDFSRGVKVYDKIMTGLTMTFDIPIDRLNYDC